MKQKQHKPEKNEDNKSTLAREEQTSNDNLSPLEEPLEVKPTKAYPPKKTALKIIPAKQPKIRRTQTKKTLLPITKKKSAARPSS